MSQKFNNVINIEERTEFKRVSYDVSRKVLRQEELEQLSGYNRHKDTRKLKITFYCYYF